MDLRAVYKEHSWPLTVAASSTAYCYYTFSAPQWFEMLSYGLRSRRAVHFIGLTYTARRMMPSLPVGIHPACSMYCLLQTAFLVGYGQALHHFSILVHAFL
jgi:hypothetical protein